MSVGRRHRIRAIQKAAARVLRRPEDPHDLEEEIYTHRCVTSLDPPEISYFGFPLTVASSGPDYARLVPPAIYSYARFRSSEFKIEHVPSEDGCSGEIRCGIGSVVSEQGLVALKSLPVEGCGCGSPRPHRTLGHLGITKTKASISSSGIGGIDPVVLSSASLYPSSSFDYGWIISLPQGKNLFPFQSDGVTFLLQKESALLADEMGLGKSVQAITAARLLFLSRALESCLVICPKSLLVDWEAKLAEWAPELSAVTVNGSSDVRESLWRKDSQVYIASYDTLREDIDGVARSVLRSVLDLVILDEIQRIKNSSTKIFQSVSLLRARRRWGLSGTPIENRVEELSTIFSYLKPNLFARAEVESPWLVKATVEPYVLRRSKSAVLRDLPEKIQSRVILELTPRQRVVYDAAERDGITRLKELGEQIAVTNVVALITKLKLICNLEPSSEESCKLEYLVDMLESLQDTGEKVVVFSQYPEKTLRVIEPKLRRFEPLVFEGSLSERERAESISRFEHDDEIKVLLMSIKAGGLGLTVTRANYVVHFDSWWNPAVMSQAEDRTHRIGQQRRVFVRTLVTKDTVEQRIQTILENKRDLFNQVMADMSDTGLTRFLSEKELFGLFGLA